MNLSKSKYCKGIQCKKILWLDKNHPEEAEKINNDSVLENGTKVGELAKELFGFHIDVKYSEDLNSMINDTKALLLNKNITITEASFKYENNFCSVDILKKENNNFEIYEVKSSTEVSAIYIEDLSYQYYILTKLGYNVVKASIVYINSDYIREDELDIKKLFNIKDLTDIVSSKIEEIEKNIREICSYVDEKNEPYEDLDIKCFKPYDCPYFKYCSGFIKENSIFDIRRISAKKKIEYYKQGLYTFKQLENKISDNYKMQIDFELNNKEDYINVENIKEFLNSLTTPLYFLDFETYQQSIPEYKGVKPYDQIPFQYSLHYIEKNELKHKEFLSEAGIDPRRKLAEQLVKDIPDNVCVLAYNMSFEKSVIKKLANIYPDLKEHLMKIYENIKDLMVPFYNKDYYSKNMKGSYSIKYVLPALFPNDEALDYHNLMQVHNGSEAMNAFASLPSLTKEEQNTLRSNLLKYCELDTLAMVKIYEKLLEVTKK